MTDRQIILTPTFFGPYNSKAEYSEEKRVLTLNHASYFNVLIYLIVVTVTLTTKTIEILSMKIAGLTILYILTAFLLCSKSKEKT